VLSRLKNLGISAVVLTAGALAFSPSAHAAVVTWAMTGSLTSVFSQNQSGWVNESTASCMGCGAYASSQSANNGSAAGLNAANGDSFTMSYTFDTTVPANILNSGSVIYPGGYTYSYTQTGWGQVSGHGMLSSSINGQIWNGAERYSVVGGDWTINEPGYCVACDASNDYLYAENYYQRGQYTNTALDYFGTPYGPYSYEDTAGVAFSGPGAANGVLGDPNGYFFYGSTSFNLARYMWAMAWSSMLSELPLTIDLSDYPDTRLVQWAGTGYSDYGCDYAVGSGDATYCAWGQVSNYSISGVIESITSTMEQTPVPAPSALVIIGLGLFAVGATRRLKLSA